MSSGVVDGWGEGAHEGDAAGRREDRVRHPGTKWIMLLTVVGSRVPALITSSQAVSDDRKSLGRSGTRRGTLPYSRRDST